MTGPPNVPPPGFSTQPPAGGQRLPPEQVPPGPQTASYQGAQPDTGNEPSAPPYGFDDKGRVKRTKVSGVWIGLIAAAIVLILLIIFIAQNLNTVGLHFFGFYGKVSLGLALLVAAIAGILLAAVPGTVRILQLRKSLRRNVDTTDAKRP